MTHPARRNAAEALRDVHPELGLTVVEDPEPDGPATALRTAVHAWRAVKDDATHHLVLQDDVLLCADFTSALGLAVRGRPDDALSLFTEWGSRTSHAARLAALSSEVWAEVVDEYVPTLALVLPADLARGFARFAAGRETGSDPDDVVMCEFLRTCGVRMLVSVPNLVQHADLPSVAGNGEMGVRSSVCFADDIPAVPVTDWVSGRVASPLMVVPHFSWWVGRSECCLRDPDSRTGWRKTPAVAWLAAAGLDRAAVDERFIRTTTDMPGYQELQTRVSGILLRQLWTTAFMLGVCARGADTTDHGAFEEALRRPVPSQALSTLAGGALRRFVPQTQLPEISLLLRPVVDEAVRQGWHVGAISPPGVPPPLPGAAGLAKTDGSPSAIEVDAIVKSFLVPDETRTRRTWFGLTRRGLRRYAAVDRVSFTVRQGEFIGLLGQNGAGKSTLIKIMTGLLTPDSGTVRVLGLDPQADQVANARNIGVAFGQKTQLWWDLPARESLEILRNIYQVPTVAFRRWLSDLDDVLELSTFWQTPARQLSLGQRVRCDLAAAIIHRPPILFLDEPTIGLDILVKAQVRTLLRTLADSGDHTIVLTTHDVAEVEALCQRLIVIAHGEVVHDGPSAMLTGTGTSRGLEAALGKLYARSAVSSALPVSASGTS